MIADFGNTLRRYDVPSYTRRDAGLRVPEDGVFVQVKHWDELRAADNVSPYPEIIDKSCGLVTRDLNGREYYYVELQDRWQWFMWRFLDWASRYRLPVGRIESYYQRPNNSRIFASATPGSLTSVYVNMIQAHGGFTDAGSPEAGAMDVVTGRNIAAKGYEWLCRPCGGALLKVVAVDGIYYVVSAIDLLQPCPAIYELKPWHYFWCTQWDKYNGATRFPHIKVANEINGLPVAGTPAPLFSLGGTLRVLKDSCVKVPNGAEWSPYS